MRWPPLGFNTRVAFCLQTLPPVGLKNAEPISLIHFILLAAVGWLEILECFFVGGIRKGSVYKDVGVFHPAVRASVLLWGAAENGAFFSGKCGVTSSEALECFCLMVPLRGFLYNGCACLTSKFEEIHRLRLLMACLSWERLERRVSVFHVAAVENRDGVGLKSSAVSKNDRPVEALYEWFRLPRCV